jgi:hypothetical protein
MVSAAFGPGPRPAGRLEARRVALGVVIPVAVVALAYALWWLSDRLIQIGPLDRAAFGWAVVIPVWIGAPVSAAFAWRLLAGRETWIAAAGFGIIVSAIAALLFWQSVAFPDCAAPARTAAEWVLPALVLGLTIGGSLAASGLLGTRILRAGHPWLAVALTAVAEFGLIFVAIFVFVGVSLGAGFGSTTGTCGLPR